MTMLNYVREDMKDFKNEIRGKIDSLDGEIHELGETLAAHISDDARNIADLKAQLVTEKRVKRNVFDRAMAVIALIVSAATVVVLYMHK